MSGPNVVISVLADTAKAKSGLNDVGTSVDGIGSKFATFAKIAGAALLAGTVAVGAFTVKSIEAAGESQKVAAQTQAVLDSTAGAAGRTLTQIDKLTAGLSRMSGVDDEVVQGGENILLTFTNIKGTNFDKATQSALDMSVAMGQDLNSAALQVGKALNDPIAGVSKLTKVGVTFTDQQKKQIAAMTEAGNVAGAQGIILSELQREFGGSAQAFGDTWEGAVGKVKTAFGNIQEAFGSAFLPALTTGANAVSDIFNGITDNPRFQAWLDSVGTKLSDGLKPISDLLTTVAQSGDPFKALVDGLDKISPVFRVIHSVFDALQPQMPAIEKGFQDLGDALGGGLAQYGPQIADAFGQIVTAIVPLIPQILTLLPSILSLVPPLLDLITTILPPLVSILGTILPPLVQALSFVLTDVLAPALGFIVEGWQGALSAIQPFLDLLGGNVSIENFVAQLREIPGPFGDMYRWTTDTEKAIIQWGASIVRTIAGAVQGVVSFGGQIVSFVGSLPGKIIGVFGGAIGWLADAGRNLVQGLLNGVSSMAGKIGSFFLNLLPGWIVGPFKAALGIHSPSTLFDWFGQMIPAGLVNGVQSGLGAVRQAAGAISSAVVSGYDPVTLDAAATAGGGGYGGGAREIHIHLDGQIYLTQAEVGRAIKDALDEYDRLNGDR